jgi:hypothetical protein
VALLIFLDQDDRRQANSEEVVAVVASGEDGAVLLAMIRLGELVPVLATFRYGEYG